MSAAPKFSSEGFDLDAANDGGGEVVFEIGGGTTTTAPSSAASPVANEKEEDAEAEAEADPTAESESHKAEGNAHFKKGEYLDAIDCYGDAIAACPGEPTGERILEMRDEFNERERERMMQRHREETERSRRPKSDGKGDAGEEDEDDDDEKERKDEESKPEQFRPPHHPHARKLAVYHCNRAASLLHLDRLDESLRDADIAVLLDRTYVKAHLRRMAANERMDKTDEALQDAKNALFYDPSNPTIKKHVARLQKIEEERLEKLKEETMGKLKDLGNSILGNFGLSLDNFKAEKDPSTGSYNISFQQNK